MKKLLIKILPFLVAFGTGVILYIVTDKFISDVGLNNLLINVSAGLVSIPLVFIFYDVINKLTSRNLHNTLFESVTVEINNQLIDLIHFLASLIGENDPQSMSDLDDFLELEHNEIYQKLKLNGVEFTSLETIKQQLVLVIHKPATFDILTDKQILAVLNVVKEITFLIKNLKQIEKIKNSVRYKKIIAMNIEYILDNLTSWIESGKKDALHNHARFSLFEKK